MRCHCFGCGCMDVDVLWSGLTQENEKTLMER